MISHMCVVLCMLCVWYMQTIVSKAKKFASADMKNAVAEFEERLGEIHVKGAEDDAAAQKVSTKSFFILNSFVNC